MAYTVLNEETKFEFTYSAKQQEEVENIRKKYLPKEEDKMETLRRLDRNAEMPGTIAAIVTGIIGSLILGVGMCCCMVWSGVLFIPGIIVGILGMAILGFAYPIYRKVTKKERAKVAEQILALSEDLSLA